MAFVLGIRPLAVVVRSMSWSEINGLMNSIVYEAAVEFYETI